MSETILVVDDEPISLRFCCNVLNSCGYRVLAASSGTEAIEVLERETGVDLALVDVMMPVMNGIELIRRLEALSLTNPPRIALMSGYSPIEVERLIGGEGSEYRIFWKPFDVPLFLKMIRNVLDAPLRGRVNRAVF
jgi:CheY-like chemotaxis protein